jgi:4-hydroxy-tetrahydrodipicolinate synthase
VDMPLILFQLQPALGGVNFTTEVVHRLIEIPSVAAIKEASFDAMRHAQMRVALDSASRRITMLTGQDNFIYESFLLGAEGALLGFATLGTREHVEMLDAIRRCDFGAAQTLGARLQALADVIFAPPITDYRARTKEALRLMGIIDHTVVRPPLLAVSDAERENVKRALVRAGML